MSNQKFLPDQFRTFGPVLPNVTITERWGVYDGPLFGLCEIEGIEFFFLDCIYDIWRYYSKEDCNRLWRIYAVYDVDVDEMRQIIKKTNDRFEWSEELEGISNVIGIFWEFKKSLTKLKRSGR